MEDNNSAFCQDKSFQQERGEIDGKKTREEIMQAIGFGFKDWEARRRSTPLVPPSCCTMHLGEILPYSNPSSSESCCLLSKAEK